MILDKFLCAHPAKSMSQVRHVVVFRAPKNDADSEVDYFLYATEIISGAVTVYRQAVPDLRQNQCRHKHRNNMCRNVMPQVSQSGEYAEAATSQVSNMTVPAERLVEDDSEVFDLGTWLQLRSAKPHCDRWKASDVLVTAESDDLSFVRVHFQTVSAEPLIKRGETGFQASDGSLKLRSRATDEYLCVVGILIYVNLRSEETQVICENRKQKGSQGGALEHAHVAGKRFRHMAPVRIIQKADALCVTVEVCLEPRCANTVLAEFLQKDRVIDGVKTFTQIN